MKKIFTALAGLFCGLLNGLLGSGGGIIAVPMLEKCGLEPKQAHATSISLILPLSIVSVILYMSNGSLTLGDSIAYLPGGLAGAVLGSIFLKKINSDLLRRIFGILMLWAAARLFFHG